MSIDYIHEQQTNSYLLRDLFRSGKRHFQQGIIKIILSSISNAEEIQNLSNKKDDIYLKVGGKKVVDSLIRDIGLIFNGTISVDLGSPSPDDLSHKISVSLSGESIFRNTMIFFPGSVVRSYKDISGLWFVDSLLKRNDIVLTKNVKWSYLDDEVSLVGEQFSGDYFDWIANSIKRTSREIDELLISTIHYLQGRKK